MKTTLKRQLTKAEIEEAIARSLQTSTKGETPIKFQWDVKLSRISEVAKIEDISVQVEVEGREPLFGHDRPTD